MGTKAGQTRADAGTHKPRPLRPQYPPKIVEPVELALWGPVFWGELVSPERWQELRTPAWERWLRDGAWPPHAARHDGIVGDALRLSFAPPAGYVGGWDARLRIVALAEAGLAEVERFREANPPAAKAIAKPLREYTRRLRAVRDHPERRLRVGS